MRQRFIGAAAVCAAIGTILSVALLGQGPQSVWSGVYTVEQAGRGALLYEETCAECHGPGLEGGETAPALAGADFRWNWNGLSVGDLFERLRVSMPEGNPRRLGRGEKAEVLAFMLQQNGFPDGDVELRDRTEQLRSIAFETTQPEG